MTRPLSGRHCSARFALLLGVFALLLVAPPAFAQGGNSQAGGLPALEKRVAALEAQNQAQAQQIAALLAALAQETAARQSADAALANRASALENKTQYLSVSGTDTYFTGTNVHIRNGLGATNGNPANPLSTAPTQVNGLGNLIVGYNADFGFNNTSGSHNLVMGDANSFSSFAAIVAGQDNRASAPYASALGGRSNQAQGPYSAIVGGAFNITDGNTASILGGNANRASDIDAVVCGGSGNRATARFAVVGGGAGVVQATEFGWSAGSFGAALQGAFRSP
ncbi:MAG TPA: hypothetical protein VM490_13055 [Armatimonadaceae bacterium]|nr:hypothetical protein [Armatimonadaceae bacterium]